MKKNFGGLCWDYPSSSYFSCQQTKNPLFLQSLEEGFSRLQSSELPDFVLAMLQRYHRISFCRKTFSCCLIAILALLECLNFLRIFHLKGSRLELSGCVAPVQFSSLFVFFCPSKQRTKEGQQQALFISIFLLPTPWWCCQPWSLQWISSTLTWFRSAAAEMHHCRHLSFKKF